MGLIEASSIVSASPGRFARQHSYSLDVHIPFIFTKIRSTYQHRRSWILYLAASFTRLLSKRNHSEYSPGPYNHFRQFTPSVIQTIENSRCRVQQRKSDPPCDICTRTSYPVDPTLYNPPTPATSLGGRTNLLIIHFRFIQQKCLFRELLLPGAMPRWMMLRSRGTSLPSTPLDLRSDK